MAKKKSINETNAQFRRIWRGMVERSDVYQTNLQEAQRRGMSEQDAKDAAFRWSDSDLKEGKHYVDRRNSVPISDKDKAINKRIQKADRIATDYYYNVLKKEGLNDMIPYSGSDERRKQYAEAMDRKYSRNVRAGLSLVGG